jgi:hypothetical protein
LNFTLESLRRPRGGVEVSCTLSLTSALDRVGGQRHAPAALLPRKTRYPFYRMLGGLQSRSGRFLKISPPPGFDLRTVQPVASRYTDCAIPAHECCGSLGYLDRIFGNIADRFAWRQASSVLAAIPFFHESESTRYEIIT